MRRTGLVSALVVLALGIAVWGLPWLLRGRDIPASVPTPPALTALQTVGVPGGGQACFPYTTVESHSERARFQVGTHGRPGPALVLTLTAPGYRQVSRVAAGYPDNTVLAVPVTPPRRAVLATACIRNAGRTRAELYAAAPADRSISRSRARVDGGPSQGSVTFALAESHKHSILQRLPVTMQRASTFRPGVVGPWLLWPLALLFALGLPATAIWAYVRALASDDER